MNAREQANPFHLPSVNAKRCILMRVDDIYIITFLLCASQDFKCHCLVVYYQLSDLCTGTVFFPSEVLIVLMKPALKLFYAKK